MKIVSSKLLTSLNVVALVKDLDNTPEMTFTVLKCRPIPRRPKS
jgi:hypothetical protein